MEVTVDTNILISSTFWEGDSFKIIRKVENKEVVLILSKEIIKEFFGVLKYEEIQDKIKDKNLEMKMTVDKLISMSFIIEPQEGLNIVRDDPDDNKILECAIEGDVNYIVSQDKHLLKLKEFRGIKIVNPKEFLEIISKKP